MPAVDGSTPAQVVEFVEGLAFGLHLFQGDEIPPVRRDPYLVIAPHVRHAFTHRHPPPLALDRLEDLELARIVDRGFNAEDAPLVVHFDRVALEAVFDPPALRSALQVGDELALEESMRLSPE